MSWTNDIVLEFLDLYKREPILWESKHPLHRNRNEVNEAWHRIQSSLSINCSILDLKRKKESLMTSFRLHYNRKKKSIDETYRISWFAYSLMESFLGGKYECDSSTNQMENELLENTSSYSNNQVIPEHSSTRQSSHNSNTANQSNTASLKTRPKREKTDHAYTKRQIEDVQYIQPAEDKCSMDEYDLYGQLLAKKLRKLDEHQRDVAMHEIDNIMFRVKVQNSMPQNRTYSSESSPGSRRIKSAQSVFIVTESGDVQYADENIPYEGHMQGQPQP